MAYGSEAHSTATSYVIAMTHTATGIKARVVVSFEPTPASTEAQRDAIFQAFLTRVAGLSGASVDSAEKVGGYSTSVTA